MPNLEAAKLGISPRPTIYCPTCNAETMRITVLLPVPTKENEWKASYRCPTCNGLEARIHKN